MDRGAQRAVVPRVTKSQTGLKRLGTNARMHSPSPAFCYPVLVFFQNPSLFSVFLLFLLLV